MADWLCTCEVTLRLGGLSLSWQGDDVPGRRGWTWTMGANTQYTKRRIVGSPKTWGDPWSSYPRVGAKQSSVALGLCVTHAPTPIIPQTMTRMPGPLL